MIRLKRLARRLEAIPLRRFPDQCLAHRWNAFLKNNRARQQHPLPGELIVNLTSFPPRFPFIHKTIKTLLTQSVAPDRVILWIYKNDTELLPPDVFALQEHGLTIQEVDTDIRSYKKLVPSLIHYPSAFQVTADDDIYYRKDWLNELITGYRKDQKIIFCHRAHRIRIGPDATIEPYKRWEKSTYHASPSKRLFPTTGGGALYPPGSLHSDATNIQLFEKLAPNADDIWFYWMGILNDYTYSRAGKNLKLITWETSKIASLWTINQQTSPGDDKQGNDQQMQNIIKHYALNVTAHLLSPKQALK